MNLSRSDPIDTLTDELGIRLEVNQGLRLVEPRDASAIVRACESTGILILGLEAFRIVGDRVVPEMDLIADFSSLASEPWSFACQEAARSARRFLADVRVHEGLWLEFTLKERGLTRPRA